MTLLMTVLEERWIAERQGAMNVDDDAGFANGLALIKTLVRVCCLLMVSAWVA